jgi:D-glycero-beta-D-manno-heptose-7-phosphate kinase
MVKHANLFHHLVKKKILLAGDLILDRYTIGKTKRISPEAPVPVVLVEREEEKAGGAGNVALNLKALGMDVTLLGLIGDDQAGKNLQLLLQNNGIATQCVIQKGYKTPHKVRIIASSQQLVRVDFEEEGHLEKEAEEQLIKTIPALVSSHDLIAISDYAKGFLTNTLLRALIDEGRRQNKIVIVDPKGADFTKYANATLIKPNLSEAFAAAKIVTRSLDEAARAIFQRVPFDTLMITRSEDGISLFFKDGKREDHPVVSRQVRDGTGAGDTVLAMLAASLANHLSISESCDLANIAAACSIEKLGCVQVTLPEVARRMIELQPGNKIFSKESIVALRQALYDEPFIVCEMKSLSEVNGALLRSLKAAKNDEERLKLVVAIEKEGSDEELLLHLSSLKDIDYVYVGPKVTMRDELKPEKTLSFCD